MAGRAKLLLSGWLSVFIARLYRLLVGYNFETALQGRQNKTSIFQMKKNNNIGLESQRVFTTSHSYCAGGNKEQWSSNISVSGPQQKNVLSNTLNRCA